VEKETESAALRAKIEAMRVKTASSRTREAPLLQRVQAAESAMEEANRSAHELGKLLAAAKRDSEFARGRQQEAEDAAGEMRRERVLLERRLLSHVDR